jgi:hypothetical protein
MEKPLMGLRLPGVKGIDFTVDHRSEAGRNPPATSHDRYGMVDRRKIQALEVRELLSGPEVKRINPAVPGFDPTWIFGSGDKFKVGLFISGPTAVRVAPGACNRLR